jgi:hypothetical protein
MTIKPKIETWKHTGVKPDGTFKNEPGAVETTAKTIVSVPRGGCGSPGCNCSPGHWISITKARTSAGVITGKTMHFKSRKDLLEYAKENKIKLPKR